MQVINKENIKAQMIVKDQVINVIIIDDKEFISLTDKEKNFVYAEEANVLNIALFGMTAKE